MTGEINSHFQEYTSLLKELQLIVYNLKTKPPLGTEVDFDQLRAEYSSRTIEIYSRLTELDTLVHVCLVCMSVEQRKEAEFDYAILKERLSDVKADFRKALLISKQIEADKFHEEQEYSGKQEEKTSEPDQATEAVLDDQNLKKLTYQESILDKNSAITSKLQHVNQLVRSSLLASETNANELTQSTSSLKDLSNKYTYFADVVMRSNRLVKDINEASNAERKQIYRSIYFFISVCSYILYKRILGRPIRLFLWLFFKMFKVVFWGASVLQRDPQPSDIVETLISETLIFATSSAANSTANATASTVAQQVSTTLLSSISSITSLVRDEL